MTRKTPKNVVASVRARLLKYAKAEHEDFNYVLTRYGIERLLYRLSLGKEASQFILKGAMLFSIWTDIRHRATRDVDLLSTGAPELERLAAIFRGVCQTPVEPDGIVFDPESVKATRIREDEEYEGVRITLLGLLGKARIKLQVDVGFGDAITPAPAHIQIPTLLDQPTPALASYPRETVIAEKLHAMVSLGMGNSRMKDFFDVNFLCENFKFDGAILAAAVSATFERRRTGLPIEWPTAFTATFTQDQGKQTQWRAFLRKSRLLGDADLAMVVACVRDFAWPVVEAARDDVPIGHWSPGEGWS